MKKRIIGIDVARALAVIGMIIVNFKIVFGNEGSPLLKAIAGVFDGKAAATFVVLAGVGIALMSNSAIRNQDVDKLARIKTGLVKRAIFLFVVGLSYIVIWPADILHFYGIYMLITILLLTSEKRNILFATLFLILVYPILMLFFDYEQGWDFATLAYKDFWQFDGFFRNLLYNGFHPVFPWTAFMLVGLWFGKMDLKNPQWVKKAMKISLLVFVGFQLFSVLLISILSEGDAATEQSLAEILGTSPMPPLPIYMLSGSSIAIFVISACILIANKYENSKIIDALYKTGQLALTFYVAHVVIGMGIIDTIYPDSLGSYSLIFSLTYALVFSALCILFAIFWRKNHSAGPLEWLMRKVTG